MPDMDQIGGADEVQEEHSKFYKPKPNTKKSKYEKQLKASLNNALRHSFMGREIAPLPAVVNPDRREAARLNLLNFYNSYTPPKLPYSKDHLEEIALIQRMILEGGQIAIGDPRGDGKTFRIVRACLWSVVYGHHKFVGIVCATEDAAEEIIKSLYTIMSTSKTFMEDFPEVAYPFRMLQGSAGKAAGQLCNAISTRIKCAADKLIFPYVSGHASHCEGSIIQTASITGNIRGMHHAQEGGDEIRPSLILGDDLQTRESAENVKSTEKILKKVDADILGLSGPDGQALTAFMSLTSICKNDVADQLLDRYAHPEWHGLKRKMIITWPKNMPLWHEYRRQRSLILRKDGPVAEINKLYTDQREKLIEGMQVSWEARKKSDVDCYQHAMHLFFDRGESAFMSEYQNEPLESNLHSSVDPDLLNDRILESVLQATKPSWCDLVLATVDVGAYRLHWEINAHDTKNDRSIVLDSGIFSTGLDTDGQWSLEHRKEVKIRVLEDALRQTLQRLNDQLLSIAYPPALIGIDCGGQAEDNSWVNLVKSWCYMNRQWIGLRGTRWSKQHDERAREAGVECSLFVPCEGYYEGNTNTYKYILHQQLTTAVNKELEPGPGTRTFWGGINPEYIRQMSSESPDGQGIWKPLHKGSGAKNHYFDTSWMQFLLLDVWKFRQKMSKQAKSKVKYGVVGSPWYSEKGW